MVTMAGMTTTVGSIRSQIASAITIVMQLQRLPDGKRKVVSVSEITGMEGEEIQTAGNLSLRQGAYRRGRQYSRQFSRHRRSPNFLRELKPTASTCR